MSAAVAIVLGIGLGLSLAAPPGPMNALIAREASRHGALPGIKMGIAAPVADTIYLALLLLGAQYLVPSGDNLRLVAFVGTWVMATFAYTTWFSSTGPDAADAAPTRFGAAFIAAMTNPYQIAWWITGGFVFLQTQGLWGIAGLMLGIFGWVVVFSWLMAHGARRWGWFEPTIRVVSSVVLTAFAVLLLGVFFGAVNV